MKKLLLFAGSLAVMVSCQKTEMTPDAPQYPADAKGIVFVADNSTDTKAEYTPELYTNWSGEMDRIGIFSTNTTTGIDANLDPVIDESFIGALGKWNWNTHGTPAKIAPALYKATTSGTRGFFTATDDGNVLSWHKDTKSKFAVFYPGSLAVGAAIDKDGKREVTIPALTAQTQSDVKGASCVPYNFMVQITEPIEGNNNAVGEAITLSLKRQMTVLPLKVKNYDKLLGQLQTITVASNRNKIATTETSTFDFDKVTKNADGTYDYAKGFTAGATSAPAVLTLNLDWSDAATAYVTVLPVAREGKTDVITITYRFANKTFTKEWEVTADWVANQFLTVSAPVLDCKAEAMFIGAVGSEDGIIFNETADVKKLSSYFNTAGIKVKIGTQEIALTSIKKIISYNTKLDLAGLEKFTALTDLTVASSVITKEQIAGSLAALKNVDLGANITTVPAKAFDGATALVSFKAAGVTTIAKDAFATHNNLVTVSLPAYDFSVAEVRQVLFATVTSLDMSGVVATDGKDFVKDLSAAKAILADVTLKDGVKLAAETFKDFDALTKVSYPAEAKGSVELMGENVFNGAAKLEAIKVSNTEVPEGSFKGCALLETATFVTAPTKIALNAFNGAAKLENIDLSEATEIGVSAFEDCAELLGTKVSDTKFVLTAAKLTKLNNNVFKGCAKLTNVEFPLVAKVGNSFFDGVTAPKSITFGSVIVYDTESGTGAKMTAGSFGTTGGAVLTLAPAQTGVDVDAKTLTLGGQANTFKSITLK